MAEQTPSSQPHKPLRDENGRLLPGQTANPFGRPKGSLAPLKRVRQILSDADMRPAEELIKLLANKKLKNRERIIILTTLLEWSESKPVKETHNVNENTTLTKQLDGLTTDQLVAALNICGTGKDQSKQESQ